MFCPSVQLVSLYVVVRWCVGTACCHVEMMLVSSQKNEHVAAHNKHSLRCIM